MEDLENRKKIWQVISEFYLDTELEGADYKYIAKVLKKTNYSIQELKEIDLYEVFPILQINLLGIAGEWAGFEENWLHKVCYRNYQRKSNKLFRIFVRTFNLLLYWMRKKYWREVEKMYNLADEISILGKFSISYIITSNEREVLFIGQITEGRYSVGNFVKLQLNDEMIIRRITDIVYVESSKNSIPEIGLQIECEDKEEAMKLMTWNVSESVIEVL